MITFHYSTETENILHFMHKYNHTMLSSLLEKNNIEAAMFCAFLAEK